MIIDYNRTVNNYRIFKYDAAGDGESNTVPDEETDTAAEPPPEFIEQTPARP